MRRIPNPHSPEELRRALQALNVDTEGVTQTSISQWDLAYTHKLTVDALNGLVKCNGSGAYTAIVDNSSNWNTAYGWGNHAGLYTPIAHKTTEDALNGLVKVDGAGGYSAITDNSTAWNAAAGSSHVAVTVNGLTGITLTGQELSLTSGYAIPTTTERANWNVGTAVYAAIVDSDVVKGHVVYISGAGHINLANAYSPTAYKAIGFASDAASSGESVNYYTDGKIELTNWTSVAGTATLTEGDTYYLYSYDGSENPPDYGNPGGTGDRTGTITVTTNITISAGAMTNLVDGSYASVLRFTGQVSAGKYMRFDFGEGSSQKITEAKWYVSSAINDYGVWKWQASNDAESWNDIGSPFTLGTSTTQTLTELSVNTDGYRYYQLLGISGNITTYYNQEIEFKIVDVSSSPIGRITNTPPTTRVIKVGTAISTTVLDIEIDEQPDHGDLIGLADDDHTQYHTDTRAAAWLAAGHETTYNHANYNTAYGWGNHASANYAVRAVTLTDTRIPYVNASGQLTDSAYFFTTFAGGVIWIKARTVNSTGACLFQAQNEDGSKAFSFGISGSAYSTYAGVGANTGFIFCDSAATPFVLSSTGSQTFYVNGANRLVIGTDGYVTVSSLLSAATLQVTGLTTTRIPIVGTSGVIYDSAYFFTTFAGGVIWIKARTVNSTGACLFQAQNEDGSKAFSFGISGSAYSTYAGVGANTGFIFCDSAATPFVLSSTGSQTFYVNGANRLVIGTDGSITVGGVMQTGGYKSSDGSTGATGTFEKDGGGTITVKNGLITNIA